MRHLIFADLAVSNLRSGPRFEIDNKDRGRCPPDRWPSRDDDTRGSDRHSQSHEEEKKKKKKKQLFSTSQNAIGGNYAPLSFALNNDGTIHLISRVSPRVFPRCEGGLSRGGGGGR